MKRTTLIGLVACFACIIISILIADGGDLMNFWDIPSIFITFGGSIFATITSYSLEQLKSLSGVLKIAFKIPKFDLQADIEMIIDIANIARREGLLALEEAVASIDNPFFKKGVALVVDGADPELIKNVLEAEIYFTQERHAQGQDILDTMATYGPAYGMIGTLIGLINMLQSLDDPDSLGPGMSVALVTTFYGSVLANAVCLPLSKKLKQYTAMETKQKELLLEGLLSIQDGENPRIIRDKLNTFIARKDIKVGDLKNNETQEIR